MHSNIYFSYCIFQSNYRNSLRSSSSGKLNYPQCYLYNFICSLFFSNSFLIHLSGLWCYYISSSIVIAHYQVQSVISSSFVNDPSAGSPTETLLRLLLPLNKGVYIHFSLYYYNKSQNFTSLFNRQERRAVCTKGRDVFNLC